MAFARRPDLPCDMLATRISGSSQTCASCGAPLQGAYCAACGQRILRERHTLRSFVRSGAAQLLDLDRGFLHTLRRLVTAPAAVVRDYLAGATVKYTHPVGYLAVAFAAFALTGSVAGESSGLADGGNRIFTATAIPAIALASRALFWRSRLNYAEHLVIASYLLGTVLFALSLLQVLTPMLPLTVRPALGAASLAASVGYFTWSYTRIFEHRRWLAAAGALATLSVGIALWFLLMLLVVSLLRANA